MQRWRIHSLRVQLVPQPALPEVSGLCAGRWIEAREAELLLVPYFHIVFTLPAAAAEIAFQNKRVVDDILFRSVAGALREDH